ncbi:uncharacterized protein LOC108872195 [Brassica rapa]|nr:uncharacterized protein LOC108872195 [Brassica rapa]
MLKLDRSLVNPAWSDSFPSGRCQYLGFEASDHRTLITVFDSAKRRRNRLFRFDRRLRDNEEVKELIANTWNSNPEASVNSRLAQCRRALSTWTREQHFNSKEKINKLKQNLDEAMTDPQGNDDLIALLNAELMLAYKAEEEFWRQRSRIMWLSLGDRNSGYFHAVAKGRKARNRMSVIEDSNGIAYYEEEQIASQITAYFTEMFSSLNSDATEGDTREIVGSAIRPSVSESANARLSAIPNTAEIKTALFLIHPDKAPGPDGFSASFFHSNWSTVGTSLIREIQAFFRTGLLPTVTNVTYVRLIPKSTGAKLVSDYRPIALCNVAYKVITKILSLRLKPILQDIISETQSAFVPGRAISDNVLITHEILHSLKTSEAVIRCSMAVKTDMSKAYDRLEWRFIEEVLTRFGFAAPFVHLIMQCVTSVSYSFLINDSVHGKIIPSRGIRQGDPLSPYLFILCGEVLSGLCLRAQRSGHLSGLRVAIPAPRINHLLFADDTMFFLGTDDLSCISLMEIIHKYRRSSGQMINASKSSIFFSAMTPQVIRERVKSHLGIEKEGGVGKYLGLPEHFGRRKRDLFTGIVDRIRQQAACWSSRQLSPAGKLVMLKSVLTATPAYTMTCFQLPVSLCKRIQSALTRFWWDESPEKRKMCWVAWETLTAPKALGGLGIRDIQAFNTALLAKQSWRIISKPDCLLSRVLRGKYCSKVSFLEVEPLKSASHGWRGILAGRDLLATNLGKAIGDGESTRIWKDPWLSPLLPTRPIGPANEEHQDLVVADFLCRGNTDWNIQRIKEVLPNYLTDILNVKPSIMGVPDSFVWLASRSGVYTAKSGYYVAASMELAANRVEARPLPDQNLYKSIWASKIPPKLHLFLWKIMQGALALGENLARRGILNNISCRHCGEPETTDHLFLHGVFTRQIWSSHIWSSPFDPRLHATFAEAFIGSTAATNLPPLGVATNLFPWITWGIWTARNYYVFENRVFTPKEIIANAIRLAREWSIAQTSPYSSPSPQLSRTLPPTLTSPFVVCFTDAAWQAGSKKAGCGWIFTDHRDAWLKQGTSTFNYTSSPLMAEALAVRTALLNALEAGYTRICIKSDCQALVAIISSKQHPADLHGITRDIEFLSLSFDCISFVFISRNLNSAADALAKSSLYSAPTN